MALAVLLAAAASGSAACAQAQAPPSAQAVVPLFPVVPPGPPIETKPPKPCQSALCQRAQLQLEDGCTAATDVPYAETMFLRRGLEPELPPELASALAEAMMSQDPETAMRLLGRHLNHGSPTARHVAALHLALIFVRSGAGLAGSEAQAALEVMRRTKKAVPFPASDYRFLQALERLERGARDEARHLLEEAIAREPRFFNAIALALRLQMHETLREERKGPGLCERAYRRLFSLAGRVMDLEACPLQAAHLAIFLERELSRPESAAPFNAVSVYLALLAHRSAAASAAALRFMVSRTTTCRPAIAHSLNELLKLVDPPPERVRNAAPRGAS